MKQSHKTIILWLLLILMFVSIWRFSSFARKGNDEISYGEFIAGVDRGAVTEVLVSGETVTGKMKDEEGQESEFFTVGPVDEDLRKELLAAEVDLKFKMEEKPSVFQTLLASWLPMLLIFGLFFFFMRQLQSGGGKAMSFGKSKARLLTEQAKKVTFADIAGIEEAKDELREIVEFLKDPKRFTRLGGRIPKGVLLMGSPGTGKTLLARSVAGEAGVPFFSISGSDFVEMFVGVGASRVRDLFEQGKKHAPCIVFIDEIDAVGRHRGAGLGGGHDEREQTLNQLLVEMDGFESNDGVILIAATNRPDVLDPALLRPGRFDRRVVVPLPDYKGREGILKVHLRKVPVADDVDLTVIAKGTPGFSGADLENLVNEAALLAARKGRDRVLPEDIENAKDKVLMGSEMKSRVISDKEKKVTAYHEAGHALVSELLPNTDPIHKVTIIPRGRALGVTQHLPAEDRLVVSKDYALNTISVLMAGRVAEEVVFDQITTGAGNDIEKATELARKMTCEWGMSKKLGPLAFGKGDEQIFLGREISKQRDISDETARDIDSEVKRIVLDCYQEANRLIVDNRQALDNIAHGLLEYETLEGEEVRSLVKGMTLEELRKQHEAAVAARNAAEAAARSNPDRPKEVRPGISVAGLEGDGLKPAGAGASVGMSYSTRLRGGDDRSGSGSSTGDGGGSTGDPGGAVADGPGTSRGKVS